MTAKGSRSHVTVPLIWNPVNINQIINMVTVGLPNADRRIRDNDLYHPSRLVRGHLMIRQTLQ